MCPFKAGISIQYVRRVQQIRTYMHLCSYIRFPISILFIAFDVKKL